MIRYFVIALDFIIIFNLNAFGQKRELKFDQNGEFKIVQFTDMHLQTDVAQTVYDLAKEIVEMEKPDLVVITGDVTFQKSVEDLLNGLANIFADKKIPWVTVLGNHDTESGTPAKKFTEIYRSLPYNLNSTTSGIKGETNYIIPIAGKDNKQEALLYFFDSNTYNTLKGKVDGSYGWIEFSQIDWYRKQSAGFTKKNNGTPIPSLSFFHIPLPEYKSLWDKDSIGCIGSKHEKVCSASINSGMYTSMLECGDIMGMFVGHDHVNDYIGNYNGIAMAYGRFSGTKNIYGDLTPGARVIVLKEGKREFDTWIREKGGNVVYQCQYPGSFIKK